MWRLFLLMVFLAVLGVEFYVRTDAIDWSTVDLWKVSTPRRGFVLALMLRTYPWSILTGLACVLLAVLPGRLFREPSPN